MSTTHHVFAERFAGLALALALALAACREPGAPVPMGSEFRATAFNGEPLPVVLPPTGRWEVTLEEAVYTFTSASTVRVRWRLRNRDLQTGAVIQGESDRERTFRQSGGSLTILAGICIAIVPCIDDRGVARDDHLILHLSADPARTLRLARVR